MKTFQWLLVFAGAVLGDRLLVELMVDGWMMMLAQEN